MVGVKVYGVDEKGREHTVIYDIMFENGNTAAILKAIEYANREYNSEYDEHHKAIPGSVYKEFAEITKVEVVK